MVNYLEGLILQAHEKVAQLKGKFDPSELDGRFHQLASTTYDKLDVLSNEILELLASKNYQGNSNQQKRFEKYQEICRELDDFENVVLAVLSRYKEDDIYMTALTHKICKEIKYPFPPPTVSCLSQSYYCLYSQVNLICVPLLERYSLLHLPDFYHELGHPLITMTNHPKAKKYQEKWAEFNKEVRVYFEILRKKALGSNSRDTADYYDNWKKNWINTRNNSDWSTELFCDLFAVYTCGPAYVWSHFYLSTKKGYNPFEISPFSISSHPNDDARMRTMLFGLEILNCQDAKVKIEQTWTEYINVSLFNKSPYQGLAYPITILKKCAHIAYEAIENVGCLTFHENNGDSISKDLNDAWISFWNSPTQFSEWEKNKIESMESKIFG